MTAPASGAIGAIGNGELGFGLGLRRPHHDAYLDPHRPGGAPRVDWLEVISENHMVPGGRPVQLLERLRLDRPIVLHGVSMSIGGTDPLDPAYLDALARLAARVEPAWISDHLCWTGVDHRNLHDLLPLPYTEAALQHVAGRILQVQDRLKRRLVIENVSSYVRFAGDEMSEAGFIVALLERSDCELLLDLNNLHVSHVNHGLDPIAFLAALPPGRVRQIHLAGHEDAGDLLVDTHDRPVGDAVWALYRAALHRFGPVATMIERDDRIPPLAELERELDMARRIAWEVHSERALAGAPASRAASAAPAAVPRPTMPLRIQQRDFDAAVRLRVDVPGLLQRAPANGLAVYRHAYVARLVAALRDNFEVLARAMGDAAFDRLARAFGAEQPSRTPSIRWFGGGLAAFMGEADDTLVPHPALADLARMEWALRAAFDAADAEPLAAAELARLPAGRWAALRFSVHPGMQLLSLAWQVVPAYRALREALDREAGSGSVGNEGGGDAAHGNGPAVAEAAIEPPPPGTQRLLVWRRGLAPCWRVPDDGEASAIDGLLAGAPFEALCEAEVERDAAAAAARVAGWLRRWVDEGWLVGVTDAQEDAGGGGSAVAGASSGVIAAGAEPEAASGAIRAGAAGSSAAAS